MRNNSAKPGGNVGSNVIAQKEGVKNFIKFRVMHMMNMREKMMRNMIVEPAKNKIGKPAERIKIVGALYLVYEPGTVDVTVFIG